MGCIREEVVQFGFCFSIPAAHMGIYLLGLFKTCKEMQRGGEGSTELHLCGVLNYFQKYLDNPAPCPGSD